jgi:hypothetical protein
MFKSFSDGNTLKIDAGSRDGDVARLLVRSCDDSDNNPFVDEPTVPNIVEEAPFSSSHFRIWLLEMVEGCGLDVKMVVEGTVAGGKYDNSERGTRFVEGVEVMDFGGDDGDVVSGSSCRDEVARLDAAFEGDALVVFDDLEGPLIREDLEDVVLVSEKSMSSPPLDRVADTGM